MEKLISVIIPVFNSEKYLDSALESIFVNTYKNIEIIIVNDGSQGDFASVRKKYSDRHNVKFIEESKNVGSFKARMIGFRHSKGDYISFIDSDDFISVDWFRSLVSKIEKTNSDIVVGDFNIHRNATVTYFPRSVLRKTDIELVGDDVQQAFFEQAGRDFTWHVLWNKLYTRQLVERAFSFLESIDQHIVMCEDIMFSSLFFLLARKVANVHNNYYYYCRHDSNVTSDTSNYKEHVSSICNVFSNIDYLIGIISGAEKYRIYLDEWYDRVLHSWEKNAQSSDSILYIKSKMKNNNYIYNDNDENYFYYEELFGKNELDEAKRKIIESDVVSFDVFDTLVVRPFFHPTDIFYILDDYVSKECNCVDTISFSSIRIEAERLAREKINGNAQDITLDEIYDEISDMTCFDAEFINKIKRKEIEIELRYISKRKTGYELYELALYLGKKIIIISDMYLSESCISKMLKKCEYTTENFDIYVSSQVGITKSTGDIFKYVKNKYKNKKIVHIGDNYHSDFCMAVRHDIAAIYLPKTIDLLLSKCSEIYSGNFWSYLQKTSPYINTTRSYCFLGFRCALALIANNFFDNPYVKFNKESDFNNDVYQIGYAILGMYILGCSLHLKTDYSHFDTIQFLARDGFVVKEAFDYIKNKFNLQVQTNYLYVSRRALVPLMIENKDNIYTLLENNGANWSAKMLMAVLKPCYEQSLNEAVDLVEKEVGKSFLTTKEKIHFLTFFANNLYSQKCVDANRRSAEKYFQKFLGKKNAIFDVGYSCRADYILKKVFNYEIESYFIHANNSMASLRSSRAEFRLHPLYDFTPRITGSIREIFMSRIAPSCIGYNDGLPVFDSFLFDYVSKTEIIIAQDAAVHFVKSYIDTFFDDFAVIKTRSFDLCAPFETFLENAKEFDRNFAKLIPFESSIDSDKMLTAYSYWVCQIVSEKSKDAIKLIVKRLPFIDTLLPLGSGRRELAKKAAKKIYYCLRALKQTISR
ncbi:HAD-IA family hydrolase [Desulfovibrio piger]|uniref:HAD-IA family hydrolase n=1 Tax=Desulfovibrio piger TaxID=901 RepID=A0A848CFN7_9BACT|nr:HAD-IA family hydrolase [Desulfovibrio piger]NME53108.1 HAD-IA family hydrolase [Desulfovibrio piger]